MTKFCTQCNIDKPFDAFYKDARHKSGYHSICKTCRYITEKRGRALYIEKNKNNPIDSKYQKRCGRCKEVKLSGEFCRQLRTKDGLQAFCKMCERERKLEFKYKLTQEDFLEMYNSQQGICPICLQHYTHEEMVVDHDHETDVVRSLLCDKCNRGLGFLRDDATICRLASLYLTSHKVVG